MSLSSFLHPVNNENAKVLSIKDVENNSDEKATIEVNTGKLYI